MYEIILSDTQYHLLLKRLGFRLSSGYTIYIDKQWPSTNGVRAFNGKASCLHETTFECAIHYLDLCDSLNREIAYEMVFGKTKHEEFLI